MSNLSTLHKILLWMSTEGHFVVISFSYASALCTLHTHTHIVIQFEWFVAILMVANINVNIWCLLHMEHKTNKGNGSLYFTWLDPTAPTAAVQLITNPPSATITVSHQKYVSTNGPCRSHNHSILSYPCSNDINSNTITQLHSYNIRFYLSQFTKIQERPMNIVHMGISETHTHTYIHS